jgi:hypothetical protein
MNERSPVDKFAPLTKDEIAAVPVRRITAEGKCLMPVPIDVKVPDEHPKLKNIAGRWTYYDAAGEMLFEVWRFETAAGKEFRPLSFWRAPNGRQEWQWKGVPEPRPLYGLDRLADRPDAPVLVVEGEKTCDAATRIIPQYVCVTSAGGSKASAYAQIGVAIPVCVMKQTCASRGNRNEFIGLRRSLFLVVFIFRTICLSLAFCNRRIIRQFRELIERPR